LDGIQAADWQPDLAALDALVASLEIDGVPASGLQGRTWAWNGEMIDPATGEISKAATSGDYNVSFSEDGVINYIADCNSGTGSYTSEGGMKGTLQAALSATTLASCDGDSRDQEFTELILGAKAFRVLPGGLELVLSLPDGSDYLLRDLRATAVEEDLPAVEAAGGQFSGTDQSAGGDHLVAGLDPDIIQMNLQSLARSFKWTIMEVATDAPVAGDEAAAEPGSAAEPQAPRYILLTFDGEDAQQALNNNGRRVAIYPLADAVALAEASGDPSAAQQIAQLQQLLAGAEDRQAPPIGHLPLFPLSSPVERWAQFRDLPFVEGQGIRYFTGEPAAEAHSPWTNQTSAYAFQGLSGDGRFYVSLYWPARTDSLADTVAGVSPEQQAQAADPETYAEYLASIQEQLNALPGDAFQPDLAALDAMISSLTFR
jgi:hypothetical protein